jgi:glycosyltransferase involved in cell wall biosynthesis
VAFLGYPVGHRRALADPTLSLADNRMQHGYLLALRSAFVDVAAFSSVPADEQHGRRPVTTDDDGVQVRHLGTAPSRLLRPVAKVVDLYRELATWAGEHRDQPRVLVYYNTFLLYGLVGRMLRVRHGVSTVPISITLPYRSPDARRTWSARVQGYLSARLLRRIDKLVVISPFLGEAINPRVRPCVVRGAVPDAVVADATPRADRASGPRRIVYAGNLSHRYNLDAAVAMLDHLPAGEFELHVYGRGALEAQVRAAAERSPAVHFHGAVAESAVPAVLRDADLLLALLTPDDYLARYSFPSKLFESLASGTPVLTTALPTLDPAMAEHLVIVESLDPATLALAVREVADRSPEEGRVAAAAALSYLRDHGTWSAVGHQLHTYLTDSEDQTSE